MSPADDDLPERADQDEPTPPAAGETVRLDDGRLVEITTSATLSAGPLPPPEVLARYGQVSPDLVERIVAMAEAQGQHRRDLERRAVDADIAQSRDELGERRLGQWLGFTIAVAALGLGSFVILQGHDWGAAIGAAGVAGLAAVFVRGRRGGRSDEPEGPQ